jgi:hypothetical protein
VSLLTSGACSSLNKDESANAEEVVFDDGYKTSAENEIIFDDNDLGGQIRTVSTSGRNSQEIITITSDNSKISTTIDVYGNKTDTRTFNYNPRLAFILLRTSADGKRQVFVYGQNGEVKGLPENILDKVLTAPADEIANSAGIYNTITNSPSFVPNAQSNTATLQPPVTQPSIKNRQIEQMSPKETEMTAESVEKTAQVVTNLQPPEQKETITQNQKPKSKEQ